MALLEFVRPLSTTAAPVSVRCDHTRQLRKLRYTLLLGTALVMPASIAFADYGASYGNQGSSQHAVENFSQAQSQTDGNEICAFIEQTNYSFASIGIEHIEAEDKSEEIRSQTTSTRDTRVDNTSGNAGRLAVNDSSLESSEVFVLPGGTLGGNGFVGNTHVEGGALSPGNSIGELHVHGNLTFSESSTFVVEVSPTSADRTIVTGNAELGDATVHAIFSDGDFVNKRHTILTAANVTGRFSELTTSNRPRNITASLAQDSRNVFLDIVLDFNQTKPQANVPASAPRRPKPQADAPKTTPKRPAPQADARARTASTPAAQPEAARPAAAPAASVAAPTPRRLNVNQQNVANAIVGSFERNGRIQRAFTELSATGLSVVSGELGAATQQTALAGANQFINILTNPTIAGRGGVVDAPLSDFADTYASANRPPRSAMAMYNKVKPKLMAPKLQHWSVWASAFGGVQSLQGDAATGSGNTTSRIYGGAVGADYLVTANTLVGVAMAGGASNFFVSGSGRGNSDMAQVGAFLRHNMGPSYVVAALAYGWQDVATSRMVGLSELGARFNTHSVTGRAEVGYRIDTQWVGLRPYVAGQVSLLSLPNYGETARSGSNLFGLDYAGRTVTAPRSEIGMRAVKSLLLDSVTLTLRGNAAWVHNFNVKSAVTASFQSLPGSSFVVNGASQARNAALLGASANINWQNGWSTVVSVESELSKVAQSYTGKATLRYAW